MSLLPLRARLKVLVSSISFSETPFNQTYDSGSATDSRVLHLTFQSTGKWISWRTKGVHLPFVAGTGSVGLNTEVQVSERPVTQQGLVGMKTGSQGDFRPSALLGVPTVAVCLASLAIAITNHPLRHCRHI